MKFKFLSQNQIIISLDRLTRFKPTKEKYLRVYNDIILSCMTEPIYKKSQLEKMNFSQLTKIAQEIFNASLYKILPKRQKNDYSINKKLSDYENSIFINDGTVQDLLNNKIDYQTAVDLVNDSDVLNLRWLKYLCQNSNLSEIREKYFLKYPIEKVILVEGITEEILLPVFSAKMGVDFNKCGFQVIPAGGKNQVVKLYYKLVNEVRIPIFLLLDKDAEENFAQIMPRLRNTDKVHLLSCGEFEDLLPHNLILKTLNKDLYNFATITESDLSDSVQTVKSLENIFKQKGLHEFKKAEFAKLIKENITQDSDISQEIRDIVKELVM